MLVVSGLAGISQGATCHPPIVPVAAYMPVAPAMRPAGSVTVSGVGGGALGVMGPRFEERSSLASMLFGGAGRVELHALDGVSFALSGGAVAPLGQTAGAAPFVGAAHGVFEARFRVLERHSAFVNAGGGAQMWVQNGSYVSCSTPPCPTDSTPSATVLSPIVSLNAGFGATWIQRASVDWYSNFSLGLTYGTAFIVSPPVSAPTVRTAHDVSASLLVSTGLRITLLRDARSRVRWSMLLDLAALGRTEPLAAGILTIGTSLDFDQAMPGPQPTVRRLERE
ncbi:MAG: hypothetical protein U0269_23330 [Polyangiales bacterium]